MTYRVSSSGAPYAATRASASLPCYHVDLDAGDKGHIAALVTMLATTSLFMLNQTKVKQLGAQLNRLHPLAVWKHIANDHHLSQSIKKINKPIVWARMKDGYAHSFMKHARADNLSLAHYRDFAASLPDLHPFKDKMPATAVEWRTLLDTFMQ